MHEDRRLERMIENKKQPLGKEGKVMERLRKCVLE
jgi:hypothetical protein